MTLYPPGSYAILLLRISTNQETQESLPAQESMGRKAAQKLGLPVEGVCVDEKSRSLWPRPGIESALTKSKDPLCAAIIGWEGSRIWGDARQQLDIFEVLQGSRTELRDMHGTLLNAKGEVEEFKAGLDALLARLEVSRLRRRVYETHTERVERGEFIQRPPYGIRHDGNSVVVDEEQMVNLRRAWRWIAEEGLTIYQVSERWNAAGVRTKKGAEWSRANISRTLTNRIYIGEMTWNRRQWVRAGGVKTRVMRPEDEWITRPSPLGNLVAEPHDCSRESCDICAEATAMFEKAGSVIAGRRRQHVAEGTGAGAQRVFGTLVHCGRCGRRMYCIREKARVVNGKRRYERYTYFCKKTPGGCQTSHSIGERSILRYLKAWILDTTAVAYAHGEYEVVLADRPDDAQERASLKASLAESQAERKGYLRMRAKGEMDDEEFAAMSAEVLNRIGHIESRLADIDRLQTATVAQAQIVAGRSVLASAFDYLVDEEIPVGRRQLRLATLLDRVVVNHPNVQFQLRG